MTVSETIKVVRPSSKAGDTLVVILFLGVSALIVTKALYYFDLNDSFYASTAARSGVLYKDIHFVQAPLGYWFWHWIYLVVPSGYAYATMRVVSALFAILSFIPPLILLRTNLQRAVFLLLAASSYYVIRSSFEIATYSLALALSSAGIALFLSRKGRRAIVLSGLLFGLAASAKINHVLLFIPALMFILLDRDSLGSRLGTAIRFLALFCVGLLPILYHFAVNPYAFYLHNVAFHSELTPAARGLTLMLSLKDIAGGLLHFANQNLIEIGLLATVLVVALVPALVSDSRTRRWSVFATLVHDERYRPITIVFAFFVTAMVMGLTPMIMFVQYLILPAFLLILGLVLSFELLPPEQKRFALLGVCLIRGCQLVLEVPHVAETALARPNVLTEHMSVSKEIERVAAAHPVTGVCEASVFSITGSFVIDTPIRLSKYTEGGIFWSRMDGFVSDRYWRDARFNFDPNLVKPVEYLLSERIAYVLVGYHPESKFEQEFAAAANGFTPFPVGQFQEHAMSLFVRNDCAP
jgi:hypothetical protein